MEEGNQKKTATIKWVTKDPKKVGNQLEIAFSTEEFGDKTWFKVYIDNQEQVDNLKKELLSPGNEISFLYEMNQATEITLLKKAEPKEKKSSGFSGRPREPKEEKFAGFACAYAKDLIIADKVKVEDFKKISKEIFEQMIELSNSK